MPRMGLTCKGALEGLCLKKCLVCVISKDTSFTIYFSCWILKHPTLIKPTKRKNDASFFNYCRVTEDFVKFGVFLNMRSYCIQCSSRKAKN